QDYHTFLFQRFFRLAPVFAFFCILYILHASFIVGALEKLDTTQNPVYSVIPLYAHGAQYWYIHLPAHIAMVHGLLEPWIPAASLTILPPGWTMTIEWQFYLLAPFLVLMIQ